MALQYRIIRCALVEKTYNGLWHGLIIPVFTLPPPPHEVKEPVTGVKTFLKTLGREELEFVVSQSNAGNFAEEWLDQWQIQRLVQSLTYYSSPFQPFNHCALFKSFKPSDAQTIRL